MAAPQPQLPLPATAPPPHCPPTLPSSSPRVSSAQTPGVCVHWGGQCSVTPHLGPWRECRRADQMLGLPRRWGLPLGLGCPVPLRWALGGQRMGAWLQEAPVATTPIFFLVGEKVFQSPGAPLSSAESFGSRREVASRETCVLSCPRPGLPTWTESLPLLWMAVPVSLAGQQCLQEVSPLQEAPVKLHSGGPPPSRYPQLSPSRPGTWWSSLTRSGWEREWRPRKEGLPRCSPSAQTQLPSRGTA